MTTFYTVRLNPREPSRIRLACDRAGALLFDITRGTGGPDGAPFAPSHGILDPALAERKRAQKMRARDPHKADRVELAAWSIYCAAFVVEMHHSQAELTDAWSRLLAGPPRALGCYCGWWTMGTGATVLHCHRVLVAECLVGMGAAYGGELST